MTTAQPSGYDFVSLFYTISEKFQREQLKFKIHVPLISNPDLEKLNYSKIHDFCLSGGRYCYPDTYDSNHLKLTGQQAVELDLNLLCLQNTSSLQTVARYLNLLDTVCQTKESLNKKGFFACALSSLTFLDIDLSAFNRCVNSSFEGSNKYVDDNSLLRGEQVFGIINRVQIWPLLVINGEQIKGDYSDPIEILSAVCASFASERYPEVCAEELGYRPMNIKDIPNYYSQKYFRRYKIVIFTIILCITCLLTTFALCRRSKKKKYQRLHEYKIEATLAQYAALYKESGQNSGTQGQAAN